MQRIWNAIVVSAVYAGLLWSPVNSNAQTQQSYNGNQNNTQAGQSATGQAPSQRQLTPQQQAAQRQAAEQAYAQQQAALQKAPQLPEGFPLEPAHIDYITKLLDYWEQSSQRVDKYKCNFRRFAYDNAIVNWRDQSNQLAAHQIAFGEIRFAAPDRASYQNTNSMKFVKPPEKPGDQAQYRDVKEDETYAENKDAWKEHWICDGKNIFEFDYANKKLYETQIPPEMQGNVVESPLPFLFGAKKKQILDRYWVRSATPRGVENEYWLVAYPKRIKDARLYSKVEIILSKEDFLPKAMHMYTPQYDPRKGNEESYYFTFENRQVNSQLDKLLDFNRGFIKPRMPAFGGWKKVVLTPGKQNQAAAPAVQTNGQPATRR